MILKAINFLNHQIPNLENPASIESINKTYWYQTQAYVELRYKIKQAHYNYFNQMQSNQPDANNPDNVRFRELMLCLPEIRHLAVKLQNIGLDKVPLLLKAVIQTIKITTKNESCIQTVKKVKNFTVPDSKNLNLGSGNVCTNASLKVKHENLSNQISENSLSESLKRPSSSSDNEAAQILSSLKHDVPIAKRPRASSGEVGKMG